MSARERAQDVAKHAIYSVFILNGILLLITIPQANLAASTATIARFLMSGTGVTIAALIWLNFFLALRYVDAAVEAGDSDEYRAAIGRSNTLMGAGTALWIGSLAAFVWGLSTYLL